MLRTLTTLVLLGAALTTACSGDDSPAASRTTSSVLTPLVAAASPVGSLDGTPSVGADGAARYTIPLQVVPGRAGVEPSLALSFSSRAGNGELGVGWSVSGASQITPCGSAWRSDGAVRPFARLCLDGKLLVAVGGNEYRTEPCAARQYRECLTTT